MMRWKSDLDFVKGKQAKKYPSVGYQYVHTILYVHPTSDPSQPALPIIVLYIQYQYDDYHVLAQYESFASG